MRISHILWYYDIAAGLRHRYIVDASERNSNKPASDGEQVRVLVLNDSLAGRGIPAGTTCYASKHPASVACVQPGAIVAVSGACDAGDGILIGVFDRWIGGRPIVRAAVVGVPDGAQELLCCGEDAEVEAVVYMTRYGHAPDEK